MDFDQVSARIKALDDRQLRMFLEMLLASGILPTPALQGRALGLRATSAAKLPAGLDQHRCDLAQKDRQG